MTIENMSEELFNPEDDVSTMCSGKKGKFSSDEELALHIVQRFNICKDTLDTMPSLEEHLGPMLSKVKKDDDSSL